MPITARGEYTLDLVADDGTYTLDTGNVGYIPEKILLANLIDANGTEIPLTEMDTQRWYALGDKTVTSATPVNFHSRAKVSGVGTEFHVWPVPSDTTYDVKMWIQYKLRDVDAITDDIWISQEWYMALSWGLAAYIAPKFGLTVTERRQLMETAQELRFEAENSQPGDSVFIQPDIR